MSEMIDRVANVIGHDSDCAVHNAPALPVGKCDCSVADTAHDVILAMREPTETMVHKAKNPERRTDVESHAIMKGVPLPALDDLGPVATYKRMIDGALK